ncbi:MAG: hypothetical protein EZS28_037446 [Streblomastix strix]|uniref:Uncharacterized protein n=1 Tax=Streblomastix strix TaxID=222440 RepID=A0A5J4U8X4_9EUKA|nr:MAG: hypothetical protein EZS28_037446 [Streblomastix strix]
MIDNPIMNQPSTLPSSALEKRMFHALTSQAGSTIDVELENYGIEDEAIIIEDQQTYFNDPAVKLLQSEENSNSGFKKNEFDDKDSNQENIDEENTYTRKNESGTIHIYQGTEIFCDGYGSNGGGGKSGVSSGGGESSGGGNISSEGVRMSSGNGGGGGISSKFGDEGSSGHYITYC